MITAHAMNVGDGYQYLTNHVARGDVDRPQQPGPTPSLTDYYARSGYPAGRWMGSGLDGLDGTITTGDRVEEEALGALFARCEDPTSGAQLGRPPRQFSPVEERIDEKIAALPGSLSGDERAAAEASIRATENKRGAPQPVAGFDLTATVPKSVSALWAVADPSTQQAILDAHHATLSNIIDYLEREVIFTRIGTNGTAQVDTNGIIAAAFDHWDTRATDPNLHTHLIVSNRVQTRDGDWLTIDSRTLFRAAVAFSELYDAMLADRLTAELGVDWEPRERRTRRTVAHEVSTIPEVLVLEFSQRSEGIERRTEELINQFAHNQGRLPTVAETIVLRKQATVETRAAKRHPEPFDSLSARWRERAERVTGLTPDELTAATLNTNRGKPMRVEDFNDHEIDTLGVLAVAAAQSRKSTWNHWNLTTEATRLTHGIRLASPADREKLNKRIVTAAIGHSLTVDTAFHAAPGVESLQRADGESVFTTHGGARFTSHAILGAEAYLTDRGARTGGPATHVLPSQERGLSDDQRSAVERIGTSGRHLEVLIGPAGTGKTTTLAALRVSDQGNPSLGIIEIRHVVGVLVGGW